MFYYRVVGVIYGNAEIDSSAGWAFAKNWNEYTIVGLDEIDSSSACVEGVF